jgi:drug/metabolite transporter (DMT)-like permease
MNPALLSLFAAATIFGTSGLFVKSLELPALVIASFRLLTPALILFATSPKLGLSIIKSPSRPLLLASNLTALRIFFWVVALKYASISKVVYVLYIWPIIFTFLNAKFLKEHVSPKHKLLLALSFAGIAAIYSGERIDLGNKDLLGMCCMLVVAALNAIAFTVFKKELKERSPTEVLFYDHLVGAAFSFPILILNTTAISFHKAILGSIYGISIGLAGYWLMYFGLSKTPAARASLICYVEAMVATAAGIVALGEELTVRTIIGGTLILISAWYARKDH